MTERINFYTLINDLAADNRYVVLGDTNHLDPMLDDFKYDFDLITAIKEAGFGALVLEKPPEDAFLDSVMIRTMDAVEKANPAEYFSGLIERGSDPAGIVGPFATAAHGLTTIYPDSRYSPEFSNAITQAYGVIALSPSTECGDVFLQAFWNENPDVLEVVEESINTGNEVIAQRIIEQSAGNGAFIIYGDGHFQGESDLNQMLGEGNVAVIAAIPSRGAGYNLDGNDGEEIDPPEYIYVVDEDAVIPFDPESLEVQQILSNYQSENYDQIAPESYRNCVNSLPEDLQEHAPVREDVPLQSPSTILGR